MTVAELIEELRKMRPDAIVKADAGEGAWDDVERVTDHGFDTHEGYWCVPPNAGVYVVSVGPKPMGER